MVEDNTTTRPTKGRRHQHLLRNLPAAMNTKPQAIEHTKHASTIRSPSRQDTPTPARVGRIEDSRRSWPGGDARSHSEPGS